MWLKLNTTGGFTIKSKISITMANFGRHLVFFPWSQVPLSMCCISGHLPQPASTEVVTQSSSLWGGALRDETNKRAISSRASGFFGVSFACRETEPRKNLRRPEIRLRFASNKFRRWYLINSFWSLIVPILFGFENLIEKGFRKILTFVKL